MMGIPMRSALLLGIVLHTACVRSPTNTTSPNTGQGDGGVVTEQQMVQLQQSALSVTPVDEMTTTRSKAPDGTDVVVTEQTFTFMMRAADGGNRPGSIKTSCKHKGCSTLVPQGAGKGCSTGGCSPSNGTCSPPSCSGDLGCAPKEASCEMTNTGFWGRGFITPW